MIEEPINSRKSSNNSSPKSTDTNIEKGKERIYLSPVKEIGAKPIPVTPPQNNSSSSSSPNSPSKTGQVRISPNAEEYYTHFTKLKPSSRKGQTRYRCKTCSHEFECSGKIRRIQHILGGDLIIAKEKNVRSCGKPFAPLKASLLDLYRALGEKETRLLSPIKTAKKEETSSPPEKVPPAHPHDLSVPVWQTFSPAVEASSSGSVDTIDDPWIDTQSQFNAIPRVSSNDSLVTYPTLDLYSAQQSNFAHANETLLRFLYKYDLPLSAIEDPVFIDFVQAIATTEADYEPCVIDETVFDDEHGHY